MILIVIFCTVLIDYWQLTTATENNPQLCQLSLSIPLTHSEFQQFPNGSLLHQNIMYHPEYLWNHNNTLYGCICNNQQKPCLRKCCKDNEVLYETSLLSECIKVNRSLPHLLPLNHQLVDELKNLKNLSHHFYLIQNNICPSGMYRLQPEIYEEDNFVLLPNGSLQTEDQLLSQSQYCMDWQENLENISVLVCHQPEQEDILPPTVIYPIGVIISIPFLLATLGVYAVIPELRNLYGITLMCYVGCLTAAYCFLVSERFIYHGHKLCVVIEQYWISRSPIHIIMFLVFSVVLLAVLQLCLCHTPLTTINSHVIALHSHASPSQLPLDESFNVKDENKNITKALLPICCPTGLYIKSGKCQNKTELFLSDPTIPPIYDENLLLSNKTGDDFQLYYKLPCKYGLYILDKNPPYFDDFYLLENGTLYVNKTLTEEPDSWLTKDEYCLANAMAKNSTYYSGVALCFVNAKHQTDVPITYAIGFTISAPFLAITFLVYGLLRELKNIHGLTLMAYVASLFVAYVALAIVQFGSFELIKAKTLCMILAFIIHFSFLASFFWLNVMCFDIWWTFGGFRSMQGSIRQSERKKFKIYSIYAWGCATILTMVCLIMDLHPNIPTGLIRPQFGKEACWFMTEKAKAIYFYGPAGVTFACNIVLFISTAIKIIHHKKETALQLKSSDSRRHDDNKQWFNLYLKLFIVMGINWSMEIISWLFKGKVSDYVWYVTDLANTLQGVIIFIIFVWKEKIKRLLLKRLGFKNGSFRSRNSTRSGYCSSTSTRTGTSMTMGTLQDKINSNPEMNRLALTSEESGST